ncbi:MAG: TatD family hydrolase [Bacteroidales bacterium]|nr:TatD family hydrolase [Bacteroidales bacterium]
MNFIDTHCHLYLQEFADDRHIAINQAINAGVNKILLPNIDSASWQPMLELFRQYPDTCLPMAGLHPTSVLPETIENEMDEVKRQLETGDYIAIGEIGIDLYWDKTHQALQEETFRYQIQLAKKYKLPVAIHVRKSFDEVWQILKPEISPDLHGVFHCFPGDEAQAWRVIEAGFLLGIGGVVTFKNSGLQKVVAAVSPAHIILETDTPFLAPAPYRGKRNEPAYIPIIAEKVAELCSMSVEEVAEITTGNAFRLFNL